MSFYHRLPGVTTASLATAGLAFCVLAGSTCDFVEINARPGSLLLSADGEEMMAVTADFGVLCDSEFYDGNDRLWELSRIFFYVSVSLGGAATVLGWALSTFLAPNNFNWRVLSFLSACTAVLEVPIFLIFESDPCSESIDVQTCSLSKGSYHLIVSIIIWVAVTFCTQCLDPPLWAQELSAWRIPKDGLRLDTLDDGDEELGSSPASTSKVPAPKQDISKKDDKGSSRQSDLSLPAVSTESMKDDDFDLPSPRQFHDSWGSQGSRRLQDREHTDEEGWLQERAAKAAIAKDAQKGDGVSYLQPSLPSRASERVKIVAPVTTRAPRSPKSPRSPGRSTRSGGSSASSRRSGSRGKIRSVSSADILSDLRTTSVVALPSLSGNQPPKEEYSDRAPLTGAQRGYADKYSLGLRALTKTLNADALRRRRQRRQRRGGYEEMLGDDYDSDDEPFMSPPIEVKIQAFANFVDADFGNQDFTDDENEDLMEDWTALHRATTSGVRMGLQEGYSDDEKIDFDAPVQGYHSDPEPAYYTSDGSAARSRKNEDASTFSGSLGSPARSQESKRSRGRKGRRKRAQNSPNVSVKSSGGSLLDVTIDEETDFDVLEEAFADEEGILGAFKLERTLSEPNPRQSAMRSQPNQGRALETMSLNSAKLYGTQKGKTSKKISNTVASAFRKPLVEPKEPVAKVPVSSSLLPLPRFPDSKAQPLPGAKSVSAAKPVRRSPFQTRSLSPLRSRTLRAEIWKSDAISWAGIHARGATIVNDDSMSQSSQSARSHRSKQAREIRIRRLQNAKILALRDDSYLQDRILAAADARRKDVADRQRDISDVSSSYYEDRQVVYSDLLREPKQYQEDPYGALPDRPPSPPDYSDLKVDDGRSSEVLPKFTSRVSRNESGSPVVTPTNDESPELSPIAKGETDQEEDLLGDPEAGRDISFLDESLDPPPSSDEEDEEDDEFPVNAELEMVTKPYPEDDNDFILDDDLIRKYGSYDLDDLDLQLIAVKRPIGKEYGDDEVSL